MKKLLILVLFLIASIHAFACSCSHINLADNFKRSEFVATAKIINIQPDEKNKDYHNIDIEIIELYKGEKLKSLKIYSVLNSSCAFYTEKNSIWLIFASTFNNLLSFGFCSGSTQIDRKFDPIEYPTLNARYKTSIDLKINVLKWLKQHQISLKNEFEVDIIRATDCYGALKGFEGKKKDFGVVAFQINENLLVDEIKLIKSFHNKKLSKEFLKCSKGDIKISSKNFKSLPKKTTLYAIYYFYPSEEGNDSFITIYDL
jgi:hypothetical protein